MPAQTLYFRSGFTSYNNNRIRELLLVTGGANTTNTTITNGTTTGTWVYNPGVSQNVTLVTPATGTTFNQGWMADYQIGGTYDPGTWTINVLHANTSATGTAVIKAQLWIVGINTVGGPNSPVISSNVSGIVSSASFTPPTVATSRALTFTTTTPTVIIPGQKLYMELYYTMTAAASVSTATETMYMDGTGTSVSTVVTPNLTFNFETNTSKRILLGQLH